MYREDLTAAKDDATIAVLGTFLPFEAKFLTDRAP